MTPTRHFRRYVRVRMTHYISHRVAPSRRAASPKAVFGRELGGGLLLCRDRRCFEKVEGRVFCRCELCCMRFGRMLYPELGGHPIRFRRIPGFAGNFRLRQRIRAASARVGERVAGSAEARAFYDDWGAAP